MFRSTLLKTLRDHRSGALGWGIALGLLLPVTGWAWAHAYPDAQARALIADQIEHGGLSIVGVFYGEPHRIDTIGGLIAWRGMGLYAVLLGFYVILTAAGISRGAEERGDLELVLATTQARGRLFAEQILGLMGILAVAGTFIWLGLCLTGPTWHKGILDPARAALAIVNLLTAVALFGALALLAAQFVRTSRAAALASGTAMIAAHLWNNLAFVVPAIERARAISPLYLYSRSTPLSNGHFDVAAWSLLLGITVGVTVGAGALFVRRDIHDAVPLHIAVRRLRTRVLVPFAGQRPGARLLGGVVSRGLRSVMVMAAAWGAGLGAYVALFAALDRSAVNAFRNQEEAQRLLQRLGRASLASDTGFIALALFSFLPTLLAIYGVTLASSWASEESDGRLELELTCPIGRRRYFLRRLLAGTVAVLIVVSMLGASFFVAAAAARLDLPWGRVAAAVALLIPLTVAIMTLGYAVSTWRPNAVGAVAGALVGASFFLYVLAPLFKAPDFVRDLSFFQLYGQPVIDGVDWLRVGLLCLLALLLAVGGMIAFERKDISR